MPGYTKQENGKVIRIVKTQEGKEKHNKERLKEIQAETLIELMEAVKKIANELNINVRFTYDDIKES